MQQNETNTADGAGQAADAAAAAPNETIFNGVDSDLIFGSGFITVKLTLQGRARCQSDRRIKEFMDDEAFQVLIEEHLENAATGLSIVKPEDVGALTSCLLLARGKGDDMEVFWYRRYQLELFVEVLAEEGEITFTDS